jgi:hypothetical protein
MVKEILLIMLESSTLGLRLLMKKMHSLKSHLAFLDLAILNTSITTQWAERQIKISKDLALKGKKYSLRKIDKNIKSFLGIDFIAMVKEMIIALLRMISMNGRKTYGLNSRKLSLL